MREVSGLPWLNKTTSNTAGNDNLLLQYLLSQRPSAGESLMSALPFLNLPGKQKKYYDSYNQTVGAMADTSSPIYQNIYAQQKQQGQQNLAEAIAEMSRQNRKLSMLGRAPLFDPARGGETKFRGITQGYQDVQNQAADQTQNILGNQAKNQYQMAGQNAQFAQNQAGIKGNIFGALGKIFGL